MIMGGGWGGDVYGGGWDWWICGTGGGAGFVASQGWGYDQWAGD